MSSFPSLCKFFSSSLNNLLLALTLAFVSLLLVSPITANQAIETKTVTIDNHFHEFRQIDICTAIKVPVGKGDVKFELNAISNVNNILVSAIPFEFCEDIALLNCPDKESYCERKKLIF